MNELELKTLLEAKQAEYKAKWDSYPVKELADGQKSRDIPGNDIEGLRKLHDEVNELGAKLEEARKMRQTREEIDAYDEAKNKPVNGLKGNVGGGATESKDLVSALMESPQFNQKSGGRFNDVSLDIDFKSLLSMEQKATMTTAAGTSGFPPFVLRDGTNVPAIVRPPQLIDFLRFEPTTQNAIKYMKQTTASAAAASKGEGVALAESTIKWEEVTGDIRKIGVYIPVTEEQLEDEAGIRSLIDFDLRRDVRTELDRNVTVGDGTGTDLLGLYNAANVQSQARGSDPHFDAIMKAMTKVRITGRSRPNLVAMHATDIQTLVLTRTSDGLYILGNPADAPMGRIWGLNLVNSEALTQGTGLVLDTDYSRVVLRKDVTIAASDSHGEYFIAGLLAIRCHVRAGLKIMRDEAHCRLTGL